MWTRKELKDKAKVSFKANYWKSVLVALVLMVVIGGMSIYSSASSATSTALAPSTMITSSRTPDNVNVEVKDGKVVVDVDDEKGGKVHVDLDADDADELRDVLRDINVDDKDVSAISAIALPGMVFMGVSVMLVMLVVLAVVIALYVFILSPLEVGAQRFFIRNLNQRAEVKEVAFGYDNNYKENVKTIFLRSLFIFLWSLLLIIPGIYKAYEYRMIPYLLADDPTMTKDRAFAESKRLMDGQKWNAFVLDLSFLGWNILSALTLGILGVFYVTPYQAQTNAALYEKLAYGLPEPAPEQVVSTAPVAPVAPVVPVAVANAANAQEQAMPVIVSESQPPIPPFAQVGAESADELDATASLPASDLSTTAALPEAGVDPTTPMPEVGENDAEPDSPEV